MTVYLFWLTKIVIVYTNELFPRGGVTGSGYLNMILGFNCVNTSTT